MGAWVDYECPNGCGATERLRRPPPPGSSRMHPCGRLHGLLAPLAPAGADCRLALLGREDYLAGEVQRTGDDGRPYAGVATVHGDGSQAVHVYVPAARGWAAR